MGSVPSRETHRRGIFSVQQQQQQSSQGPDRSTSGGGGGAAAASARKQEIVLIPLTKEFFPSPDCPLFVQFHKARCDAAVNYYFRRPGNPGDLSRIPNYASSYRLPGEEEALQQRRRERADRRRERAAARARSSKTYGDGLFDPTLDDDDVDLTQSHNISGGDDDDDDGDDDEEEEDESFPSREALYRGVVERVEEALFDTDAQMCEAFEWARAHPHTTMGPDGRKQRKVLPVLCAVAFRYDPNKMANAAAPWASLATSTSGTNASAGSFMNPQQQAAVENGVYMFGSIINIVGCFGFVSMEEEVEALKREMELQNPAGDDRNRNGSSTQGPSSFGPGGGGGGGMEVMQLSSLQSPTTGRRYKHDPYSFTSSQDSSVSNSLKDGLRGGGSLLVSRASQGGSSSGGGGGRRTAAISSLHAMMGSQAGAALTANSPPPVAAPLAAMVFLTKSAGEQNLGRVTHIAATTYYFQLIQAGVIPRQPVHAPPGAAAPPPPPYYGLTPTSNPNVEGSPTSPHSPAMPTAVNTAATPAATPSSPSTHHPKAHMPLPPMETFSFSSLLTNIPILSFVYEMKCRWGYLGVFRGTPTSANNSFTEPMAVSPVSAGAGAFQGGPDETGEGIPNGSFASATAHRRALLMGTHSSGGLTGVDRTVGQNLTDEIEMWVTVDQMLHGRISKDLAERLCWALAERPEVMHERVLQLPSEEAGYWRYRGLVDSAKPPPLPQPGVDPSPTIHPRDVYVMGSDVLPGFNEGDILRFDPDRLVWFSDPSIPLEGVVLAAMRPYCKQAREAAPDDPGWVTKIESLQQLEYDMAREERENPALFHFIEGEAFPLPPPTQDQEATLRIDSNLTRVHEHVGNFYVYEFDRNGTSYYHGTVPNFGNPNKKRASVAPAAAAAAAAAGAAVPHHTNAAAPASQTTATATTTTTASSGAGPHQLPAPIASPAPSTSSGKPSSTGAAAATTTTATTAATTSTAANPGSGLEVPKSIASALFSLAQPVSAAHETKKTANAAEHATKGDTTNGNSGNNQPASGSTEAATSTTAEGRDADAATAPSTAPQKPSPAYLTGRVTSTTVMRTARRWMESLYSYAYGVPKPSSPSSAGPGGVNNNNGSSSRGATPSHGTLISPLPPPRSPMTPMGAGRSTTSPGGSWSTYPATAATAAGGGNNTTSNKLGSPVSPGLGGSHVQGWGAGRSEEAAAVWPNYGAKFAPAMAAAAGRAASPMGALSNTNNVPLDPSTQVASAVSFQRGSPMHNNNNTNNNSGGGFTGGGYMMPNGGQSGAFPHPGNQGYNPNMAYTGMPNVSQSQPRPQLQQPMLGSPLMGNPHYATAAAPPPPPSQIPMPRSQPTRRYTIGDDGNYVWSWA